MFHVENDTFAYLVSCFSLFQSIIRKMELLSFPRKVRNSSDVSLTSSRRLKSIFPELFLLPLPVLLRKISRKSERNASSEKSSRSFSWLFACSSVLLLLCITSPSTTMEYI